MIASPGVPNTPPDEIALLSPQDDREEDEQEQDEEALELLHFRSTRHPRHRHRRPSTATMTEPVPLPVRKVAVQAAFLAAFSVLFEMAARKLVGPSVRGFFCNDLTIRLHKTGDIVTGAQLFLYTFGIVFLTVLLVELYRLLYKDAEGQFSRFEAGRGKEIRLLVRMVVFFGNFLIAFMVTHAICTATKFTVGRLRPYFLAACQPEGIDLDECFNTPQFISTYACAGKAATVLEARLSFFSGHSAFSMLASTYAVLYLQARFAKVAPGVVVAPFVQVLVFCAGLFISYSRIVDHSHHPTDVLVGILVGISIAVVMAKFVARIFDAPALPSSKESTASTGPLAA